VEIMWRLAQVLNKAREAADNARPRGGSVAGSTPFWPSQVRGLDSDHPVGSGQHFTPGRRIDRA
jgi:hypothetical protein